MNKTLLYLLVAFILGGAAYWTVNRNQKKSTLDKLDLNFAIPDTSSISKIVISNPENKSELERKAEGFWILNQKHKVAPYLMQLLLSTIRNVEMQRPLGANEAKTVEDEMKINYKKVDIFIKGELYKTYLVGDDAPGNMGTYFKFEEGDPYVCHLRGFTGFLSPRYNVIENEWRDKILFHSTPQTIQSIELKYPASPVDNFKIAFKGKYFGIEGADRFDTSAAAGFILGFKRIYLERYLPGFSKRTNDSLLNRLPTWSIDLVDIDPEKSHSILFYPSGEEDRSIGYLQKTKEWISVQDPGFIPVKLRRRDLMSKNP
jgi:hypothetical protein